MLLCFLGNAFSLHSWYRSMLKSAENERTTNALRWKLAVAHFEGIGYAPFKPRLGCRGQSCDNWRANVYELTKNKVGKDIDEATGKMNTQESRLRDQLRAECRCFVDPGRTRLSVIGCGGGKTLLVAAAGAVCRTAVKMGLPKRLGFGDDTKVPFVLMVVPYVTVGVAVHKSWAMTDAFSELKPYFWGYPGEKDSTKDTSHVIVVTPERVDSRDFRNWFRDAVRRCYLVAVDEAHLLLVQSHFRPSMEALQYGVRGMPGSAGLRVRLISGTVPAVWLKDDTFWKLQPFKSLLAPYEQKGQTFVSKMKVFALPTNICVQVVMSEVCLVFCGRLTLLYGCRMDIS